MAVYTQIDNAQLFFQTKLYTGDGSTQAITFDGDTDMQPDWVWIKNRSEDYEHTLFDSVRGVQNFLRPSTDGAEAANSNSLTAFGSDGFSIGTESAVNDNTDNFVAWCWKAGAGSGSSNTDGSINTTSTSVSTTAGFSISTYTGTGSNATVGHGLGVAPKVGIVKQRDETRNWQVWHGAIPSMSSGYITLNNVDGYYSNFTPWNGDTTSTTFAIGTNANCNANTKTYIAYCFAEKQGFFKADKYTGNGNADGTFINTGFRPAFVLIKNYGRDSTSWTLYDNKRPGYNSDNAYLLTDAGDVEASDKDIDLLSNGFKPLLSNNAVNTDDDTYIYMAFAEAPFVNSKGVPCNAR